MRNKLLIIISSLVLSSPVWAFSCYYNLAKGSCWTNYNLSVDVTDATTSTLLFTIQIPAGKSWAQKEFTCQPAQKLMYQARFTPVFWESDKDKIYTAVRYWFMPGEIKPGDSAWTIPVCFPKEFAEVPYPPDAKSGNCECDFSVIPEVKPK